MSTPEHSAKQKVLALEPAAHAVSHGFRGVEIQAHGEVIASGYTVYAAWAKALEVLQNERAA